jgi:hypothetical protein
MTTGAPTFPAGCVANSIHPQGGPSCTAYCADCNCSSIKYACDKACYTATGNTCLINANPSGTPRAPGLMNGCSDLTCAPENDLTLELSCVASNCTPPAPPADAGVCVGGCKAGAIRYCDESVAEWTKQTCGSDGQWGPCTPTTAPVGAGCDPNSYSPEVCCPGLKICCQDQPNGPFKDFGSGACAAIACVN